jgi:hypothetical protein
MDIQVGDKIKHPHLPLPIVVETIGKEGGQDYITGRDGKHPVVHMCWVREVEKVKE